MATKRSLLYTTTTRFCRQWLSCLIAEGNIQRFKAPPHIGRVNDIVMQEARDMYELRDLRSIPVTPQGMSPSTVPSTVPSR